MKTKPTFPDWFDKLPAWEKNEVTRHFDPGVEKIGASFLDSPIDFDKLLERRRSGEPLEYILRHCHVGSLTLELDPRVLIPRPETETMVRRFVERAQVLPAGPVLDCGTGSGFIAAWVSEHLAREVIATDVSMPALRVAARNFEKNGWPVRLVAADLLSALDLDAAAILANLPYVTSSDRLSRSVRDREPEQALLPAPDPDTFYTELLRQSYDHLSPGGQLWIEGSPGLFRDHLAPEAELTSKWSGVELEQDLRERDRYLILER